VFKMAIKPQWHLEQPDGQHQRADKYRRCEARLPDIQEAGGGNERAWSRA
jgi:hypothetical protein